jgi:high affinity Mn2+ porin
LWGQDQDPPTAQPSGSNQQNSDTSPWSFHFQATAIPQGHGDFHSPYASTNSLSSQAELATSFTSTFYGGRKLWDGAEIYVNPEILAGDGLSSTLGIAGFPNGEIYRVDNPTPRINLSRLFIRQTRGRGGDAEFVSSGQNQVPGNVYASRITVTAGKFSLVDLFDDNTYSHDARTQFMNWAIMDNGAWDFAADTRGYTEGVAVEVSRNRWAWRLASVLVPKTANGMPMDTRIARARGDNFEMERHQTLRRHAGAVRVMAYANHAHMGSYRETIDTPAFGMDITKSRAYRTKYGAGINLEQEIGKDFGVFFRYGWNDGHTETWAFTEIDRTGSGGLSLAGRRWRRPSDHFGLAYVENGLSHDHEEYLALGGEGFIIGDGKLNYGREKILETYYAIDLKRGLALSPDFQYVVNPAYNRDRGPVPICALRLHWER